MDGELIVLLVNNDDNFPILLIDADLLVNLPYNSFQKLSASYSFSAWVYTARDGWISIMPSNRRVVPAGLW